MRPTKPKETPIGGVYIAPIINVAFVLVVVLMIIAPIVNVSSIPVNLPEAVTEESKEQNITISCSKDDRIAIDTEEVSWEELPSKLRCKIGRRKDIYVIIRADKDIPFGKVDKIFDLVVRRLKVGKVAIATKQKFVRE